MNFTVSCSALLSRLQSVGRVISSKSPMAILDNFLLKVENNVLTVTASDLETTMTATLELESSDGDIVIALPAKLLMETLKEFSEQPLTFEVNTENFAVLFRTETGTYNFIGQNGMEFPKAQELADDAKFITMPAELLAGGVSKTSFATATDDLRPTMTGMATPGKRTIFRKGRMGISSPSFSMPEEKSSSTSQSATIGMTTLIESSSTNVSGGNKLFLSFIF